MRPVLRSTIAKSLPIAKNLYHIPLPRHSGFKKVFELCLNLISNVTSCVTARRAPAVAEPHRNDPQSLQAAGILTGVLGQHRCRHLLEERLKELLVGFC